MVLGLNFGKSAFVIVIYLIAAASPLHLATLLPQSSEKWPWAWLMRRAPAHKWVLSHKRERVLHENSIYCWPPLHLLLMNLRPLCTHKLVGYNNLPDFTLAYFVCRLAECIDTKMNLFDINSKKEEELNRVEWMQSINLNLAGWQLLQKVLSKAFEIVSR